jgi:plastocyanin
VSFRSGREQNGIQGNLSQRTHSGTEDGAMNTGKIRTVLLAAALAAGLAGLAGCAPGGGAPAPTSDATAPAAQGTKGSAAPAITIKNFAYGDPITVSPGATVTVTNRDSADHTVTADQGQAFDAVAKALGGTATFTAPSQPGTYAFHCTYHPNMHGTLIVK